MESTPSNVILEAIRQVREQAGKALRLEGEEISRLEQSLEILRNRQQQTQEATRHLLEPIETTLAEAAAASAPSLESVWNAVRSLMTATYAEQVLETLATETAQMNLRSVVFSVRGKVAWGTCASGFEIPNQSLNALAVPLNRANPFRQVFESREVLVTHAEGLRGIPSVLEMLQPAPANRLWLLPIRSAESVTAILYAESGAHENAVLGNALRLLAEFAGLQMDRLALASAGRAVDEASVHEAPPAPPESAAPPPLPVMGPAAPIPKVELSAVSIPLAEAPAVAPDSPEFPAVAAVEAQELPATQPVPMVAPAAPDLAALSEEEQKLHRDAQRFSRLLVSEIELYNKQKVEEGRKNKDLYQRLKKDIDRSRQTYEKRFGNTVVKQVNYFHEELVRALAENDPSLLGSDYPGPSA